ncbi:MAG TPA: pyridoxal kinase PdxY [Xanthobacteraceae bacterium]|nr:pyridoxal kinase PdxY [Xanthobacteraceae bacterium]
MNILSIQSHVAYGHVGNSAAVFPLQRIGIEVWPVHTVQFSNHTGYGAWRGRAFSGEAIRAVVEGIDERGVLGECDGVISGYLGSADIGEAVVDTVGRVKGANPAARYCCDPVIGDVGRGVFVRRGVPELIRERALPIADFVTPNQFELDFLTARTTATLSEALGAVDALHALGPRVVLVTSLRLDDTPADALDLVASDGIDRYRLRTPLLPLTINGAGDLIAALFFAHHLSTGSAAEALSLAASSLFGVLSRTAELGSREMLLVEAQQEFVTPRRIFKARPI